VVGHKDGNLYQAFTTAYAIANEMASQPNITFQRDDEQFGYLTLSPAMIGTGLKVAVRLRLPFLSEEPLFRNDLCSQHSLVCTEVATNNDDVQMGSFFELSNKGKYGISETTILQEVYRGVRAVIDIECRYHQPS